MSLADAVIAAFVVQFGRPPTWLVRAPGRVNLIGEHTDYNDGYVLPMAIDRAVWIAAGPGPAGQVALHSLDMGAGAVFDLAGLQHSDAGWVEYIKGVAWALQERGTPVTGWRGVMAGDVPIGAGLSSSAAVEMAAARAFLAVAGRPWEPAALARIGQRAENGWLGVNSGIMDQMISAAGVGGHALLIDCRSLAREPVPLPPDTSVVVLDTNTRRGLVDSAYNQRRTSCETAARLLGVTALRDVDEAELTGAADRLDPVTFRRARHVVTENARTQQAAAAMRAGDAARLGALMNASHASLRDDFEVSSPALDVMAALAQAQDGCFGARMTGAGFGGCAVALVRAEQVSNFVAGVEAGYRGETGRDARAYVCAAVNGAELISLPATPVAG